MFEQSTFSAGEYAQLCYIVRMTNKIFIHLVLHLSLPTISIILILTLDPNPHLPSCFSCSFSLLSFSNSYCLFSSSLSLSSSLLISFFFFFFSPFLLPFYDELRTIISTKNTTILRQKILIVII